MAEDGKQDNTGSLPPKLDLRKSGILKATPAAGATPAQATPSATTPAAAPAPTPAVAAEPKAATPAAPKVAPAKPAAAPTASPAPAAKPATPVSDAAAKPSLSRIQGAASTGAAKPTLPRPPQNVSAAKPVMPTPPGVKTADAPAPDEAKATMKPLGMKPLAVTPAQSEDKPVEGVTTKKKTTKIPLEAARPKITTPGSGESPIKIGSVPGSRAGASEADSPEKRKTSRISLEAVLGGESSESGEGPKTIRLKRPTEGASPRLASQAKTIAKPAAVAEAVPVDGDDGQTQKKTVVIRRTQERTKANKLSIARPAAAAAPVDAPSEAPNLAAAPMLVSVDRVNPFFGICAIAATLVVGVVIYMFSAQALGPNSSMTQYSVWVDGPNLSWPGKLSGR